MRGAFSFCIKLPLFQRQIFLRLANIFVGGADDAVGKLYLFHAVGAPAGHTGNGRIGKFVYLNKYTV